MTQPDVVSREEWSKAREELLLKEKEFTRARDQLSAERRELPMVEIDKDYRLTGPDGKRTLLDLFESRKQLIIYQFMFGPDWDEGCDGCSFLVDNIPHLSHLHAANTTLALVSRAPYPTLAAFKKRMGWVVPWYSAFESDFNEDFGGSHGDVEQHGINVFLRDGDAVYHTYNTFDRGVDILTNTFNYLDLTPLGRQEDDGIMNWVRLHDRYDSATPQPSHAD